MNYENKYIKYKNKYLKLSQKIQNVQNVQNGGVNTENILDQNTLNNTTKNTDLYKDNENDTTKNTDLYEDEDEDNENDKKIKLIKSQVIDTIKKYNYDKHTDKDPAKHTDKDSIKHNENIFEQLNNKIEELEKKIEELENKLERTKLGNKEQRDKHEKIILNEITELKKKLHNHYHILPTSGIKYFDEQNHPYFKKID